MPHYLGIDVGTSAVKALIVDEHQTLMAEADVPLEISRPRNLWSEQDPESWWLAVQGAIDQLRDQAPAAFARIRGIGLSGQMHGAVLLDAHDEPLRPAILWNDGRSFQEAEDLGKQHPHLSGIVGVLPMAGFTAPKLLWLARHEPETFRSVRKVLLPKDYIRLKLTGACATEMSDAAGTWWLDEAARDWSDEALAATGLDRAHMPDLIEGSAPSGILRATLAADWGMRNDVVVAGGAGDAAAGAVGLGAIEEGAAFISLGTSGQLFVTTRQYRPAPETLIHSFCHALPDRWFQMAAMLNGASCLAWAAGLLKADIAHLLRQAESAYEGPSSLLFLPYLAGERTPHNDPYARGVFFGLSPETQQADLIQAILEGVAFTFADAKACLEQASTPLSYAGLIGGGSRSAFWARILANVLNLPLVRYKGSDKGPAFGAARLARLAATGETPETLCSTPAVLEVIEPDPRLVELYRPRIENFRRLYSALRPEFRHILGGWKGTDVS
ncbi:xylulokinase [Microvirga guangxiensis]|uniref:Xylulose kinase n=1 Tax=Microvirga guangxiensis TaxID=549386 RepID=A0A1G5CXP6_9HYPH|nr:xylulokinase [Microvirga guangxiensis]SCY07028.1 xylulokinase [Microvirga guangxiensis]